MIDTPNRRKQKRVCYVNLLKLYRRRDEKLFPNSANAVTVNVTTVVPENDVGVSIPALSDLKSHLVKHLWPHTTLHLLQKFRYKTCFFVSISVAPRKSKTSAKRN